MNNRHILKGLTVIAALLLSSITCPPTRANEPEERAAMQEAIKQVEIGTDSEIFARFLKQRKPILPAEARVFYKQEMLKRPELAQTTVFDSDTDIAKSVLTTIQPVLDQYHRDGIEVLVLKQETPFVGLYRECLLLFSTKLLKMLSAAELRACAAHELAHEFFLDEMIAADKTGNKVAMHLIEYKCDLIAAIALSSVGDDPFSLVQAVARIEKFYDSYTGPGLETDRHPRAKLRKECLEQFIAAKHAAPQQNNGQARFP